MTEYDLTIACTVLLPEGAVLAEDKQTFLLDSEEYVLNTITFSSMVNTNEYIVEIEDLIITDTTDTKFEEVTE